MNYGKSLIHYFAMASPYLLVGLVMAGFIHEMLKSTWPRKILGRKGIFSIFWAAILGIPLPLCSCSVIPAAVALRKSGASKGATSSFLIATPESGVDSMMMTHAMMDLPMTLLRPVIALMTAVSAGFLQLFLLEPTSNIEGKEPFPDNHSPTPKKSCMTNALTYAFGKLSDDLSFWLTIGMLLGALINVFVPEDFFLEQNPHLSRLTVIVIGIPLYICATASTPVAASLILKGMSPGTALLFLLVGPATNISNLLVLQKYLGKKSIIVNILTICLLSLFFSYLVDILYHYCQWDLALNLSNRAHHFESTPWWAHVCSLILAGLLVKGLYKQGRETLLLKTKKVKCH